MVGPRGSLPDEWGGLHPSRPDLLWQDARPPVEAQSSDARYDAGSCPVRTAVQRAGFILDGSRGASERLSANRSCPLVASKCLS